MFFRWLEFLVLFVITPVVLYLVRSDIAALLLPVLCLLSAYCCHHLWRQGVLKRQWEEAKRVDFSRLFPVLLVFLPGGLLVFLAAELLSPLLSGEVQTLSLQVWLAVALIYPLFSVIPQELIFRTFFFHRYHNLFPSRDHRLWLSSACFGFAHLLYANWIAVILSFAGGLLFGYRYLKSGSIAVVIVEHSLWGLLLFSTGLGSFFIASQTL